MARYNEPGNAAPVNSSQSPVLIFGAGPWSIVVSEIAKASGRQVAGYAVDPEYFSIQESRNGAPVICANEDNLKSLLDSGVSEVSISILSCVARQKVAERLMAFGFKLATLVHPSASLSPSCKIHAGGIICQGAVIGTRTVLAEGVVVNTRASIDHDCKVWPFCHISAGVVIGGETTIGARSWVCMGATVIDRLSVGYDTIIGAGAVVVREIPQEVVAYGVPAKVVRDRGPVSIPLSEALQHG